MRFEFDPAKNKANMAKHGIDLALAEAFEFTGALIGIDARRDYGETRYTAIGHIAGRLNVMIFVRSRRTLRIISLRKANKREERKYHAQS